jgi:hypothetical protein
MNHKTAACGGKLYATGLEMQTCKIINVVVMKFAAEHDITQA